MHADERRSVAWWARPFLAFVVSASICVHRRFQFRGETCRCRYRSSLDGRSLARSPGARSLDEKFTVFTAT